MKTQPAKNIILLILISLIILNLIGQYLPSALTALIYPIIFISIFIFAIKAQLKNSSLNELFNNLTDQRKTTKFAKDSNNIYKHSSKSNSMNNLKSNLSWLKGGSILKVIIIVIVIAILISSIEIIDAGYTGVYSLFGKVRDAELKSGLHLINPLAKVTNMSIRTEEYTMSNVPQEGKIVGSDAIQALTKEGLNVDLDITALYHLNEANASDIYRQVGLNYEEKIIRPEIRSAIREIIAQYEAKDIYSEKRQEAAGIIHEKLSEKFTPRGIIIEDILLRNVQLPANLAQTIQEKLQAEQESQKYDFVLQKEKKEAERKIIEAGGQRDAQTIINESLSNQYLQYLYINQLKDLQGTIYVPTDPSNGVPLFRGL